MAARNLPKSAVQVQKADYPEQGIFILGCEIREMFLFCEDTEKKYQSIYNIMDTLLTCLDNVNKKKYPKKGVIFFIKEVKDYCWE